MYAEVRHYHASIQVCKHASMQVCKFASIQVCKDASVQVCKYANDSLRKLERAQDSPKYQIFVQKGPG